MTLSWSLVFSARDDAVMFPTFRIHSLRSGTPKIGRSVNCRLVFSAGGGIHSEKEQEQEEMDGRGGGRGEEVVRLGRKKATG